MERILCGPWCDEYDDAPVGGLVMDEARLREIEDRVLGNVKWGDDEDAISTCNALIAALREVQADAIHFSAMLTLNDKEIVRLQAEVERLKGVHQLRANDPVFQRLQAVREAATLFRQTIENVKDMDGMRRWSGAVPAAYREVCRALDACKGVSR